LKLLWAGARLCNEREANWGALGEGSSEQQSRRTGAGENEGGAWGGCGGYVEMLWPSGSLRKKKTTGMRARNMEWKQRQKCRRWKEKRKKNQLDGWFSLEEAMGKV